MCQPQGPADGKPSCTGGSSERPEAAVPTFRRPAAGSFAAVPAETGGSRTRLKPRPWRAILCDVPEPADARRPYLLAGHCGPVVVELLQSCSLLVVVAWLIVRATRQRALLRPILPAALAPHFQPPSIAAIVPARDEESNIAACLRGLIAQDYPVECLRIMVVDDHSLDATAHVAGGVAKDHPRVCVPHSPPLPPQWIGKSHACWIGACAAAPETE